MLAAFLFIDADSVTAPELAKQLMLSPGQCPGR